MLTYALNDKFAHVITLFRNGEKTSHVFDDHHLTFQEFDENWSTVYYIIAHDYGTQEKTFLVLTKDEIDTLRREIKRVDGTVYGIRDGEGIAFKKAVEAFNSALRAN